MTEPPSASKNPPVCPADAPMFHAETVEEWRDWLRTHSLSATAVWLVSWRKATGKPAVGYEESVIEALAVGWVDSKPAKLDDERTMLYFTRRKPGSGWSRPNKIRVEALSRNGLLTDVAKDMIERAKRDGSWSLLDDVEDLVVPPDLSDRFDVHPGSQANWESFPPSARRGILEWIVQAKRPPTRAQRIDETARLAALNQRANQWQRRG